MLLMSPTFRHRHRLISSATVYTPDREQDLKMLRFDFSETRLDEKEQIHYICFKLNRTVGWLEFTALFSTNTAISETKLNRAWPKLVSKQMKAIAGSLSFY